jgi:CHAT domain-containing protein
MNTALDLIESVRTSITSQELRASYFASKEEIYDLLTDLLMELHTRQPTARHDEAALLVSERSRARGLLETLNEAKVNIREGVDPTLLARERSLQQQLNAKAERLTRLLSSNRSEEQAAAAKKEVEDLLSEYQQVQTQIRTVSPRYAALTQPRSITVREIEEQVLDEDSLLLEYSLGRERSFLWAVSPGSFKSYVLPKQGEVERAARQVYSLLSSRNDHPEGETPEQRAKRISEADTEYKKAAAALSKMLLGPVAEQLGTKRLIIVSQGALQYVPFSALPTPSSDLQTTPLILKHEVVTLPSASVLAVLRRELTGRAPAPDALAVLADPVFRSDDPRIRNVRPVSANGDSGSSFDTSQASVENSAKQSGVLAFKRLRFSRQEADAIASLAPGRRNLKAIDFEANRETATSPALSRYRVLHFATHGLLNSQHPELSGIVLSLVNERGEPEDGFLRLHEIYNLKLGADLVVLSACQTALGTEIKGEGLVGLTRGFMYAGSPRVVASLWNVDDRATSELMKRFYRAMFSQKMSPSAALRTAQTSLLAEKGWDSPYYWAAFTLQGEWK